MFIKLLLAIVAIALIILGFVLSTQEITSLTFKESNTAQSTASPKSLSIQEKNINEPLTHPKPTPRSTTTKASSSTLLTPTISASINIYNTLSIEEASLQYKPRSYVKPITAIELSQHSLTLGDTMLFPNIEGIDYAIIISHIATNPDGSKSITGSYNDEGILYTTTMTESANDSFISLATTEGSYEIETRKGIGYIYKTHEIRKVMQTSPINDTIIYPSNSTSQGID